MTRGSSVRMQGKAVLELRRGGEHFGEMSELSERVGLTELSFTGALVVGPISE